MKPVDYNTGKMPNWCPGCGNFAIWNSIKKALANLDIEPNKVALVSGIGCSGKMVNYVRSYAMQTLHGRTMPIATGIKLAKPGMTVIVNGGDGDGYGMGLGHMIHAIRRNINIVYIVHHNKVYGLTTGQAAPTTFEGTVTKSTPFGVVDAQLNPLILAMAAGATFVARGYSAESEQLTDLIIKGIQHKGFALIDVFQPCVTFGGEYKYEYYDARVTKMDTIPSHDKAIALALDNEKLSLGIYSQYERPPYEDRHPEIAKSTEMKDITKLISAYI